MFALLIIPILVAGYITIAWNKRTKLTLHRYDGQLLYLKVATGGTVCLIVSFFILLWLDMYHPNIKEFIHDFISKHLFKNNVPPNQDFLSALGISVTTVFISICYICAANVLRYVRTDSTIDELIETSVSGSMQKFLYESLKYGSVLLLTLNSKKVYVGIILDLSEPSEKIDSCKYIKLFPLYSGYRDKDTLEVNLTPYLFDKNNNNNDESDKKTSFQAIIDISQISHVSLFDVKLYLEQRKDSGHSFIRNIVNKLSNKK